MHNQLKLIKLFWIEKYKQVDNCIQYIVFLMNNDSSMNILLKHMVLIYIKVYFNYFTVIRYHSGIQKLFLNQVNNKLVVFRK